LPHTLHVKAEESHIAHCPVLQVDKMRSCCCQCRLIVGVQDAINWAYKTGLLWPPIPRPPPAVHIVQSKVAREKPHLALVFTVFVFGFAFAYPHPHMPLCASCGSCECQSAIRQSGRIRIALTLMLVLVRVLAASASASASVLVTCEIAQAAGRYR
jgi:hypothetical protein